MNLCHAAALALLCSHVAVAGCADREQAPAQPQTGQPASNVLCALPDTPPSDLALKPGYRQFSVSVTDAEGRPISGLKQQDFVVSQESQTFPIAYFRENKNDEPAAIALEIDASSSMQSKLPLVKSSLGNLVENLNQCDEVELFAFSSHPSLLMPLSTDRDLAVKTMAQLHAFGTTAIYDATIASLQQLAGAHYPDRKIILITDGVNNSSRATQREVVAKAKNDGVPIYAIGIGDPEARGSGDMLIGPFSTGGESERVDAQSLEALSAAAGGRTFIVPATGDAGNGFMNAISIIADTIAHSYALGVVIPASSVTPSDLKVGVMKQHGLVVRAHVVIAARGHD